MEQKRLNNHNPKLTQQKAPSITLRGLQHFITQWLPATNWNQRRILYMIMKKILSFTLVIVTIIGLSLWIVSLFAGGVIGSIAKHEYNVSADRLEKVVDSLYSIHSEWIPPKSEFHNFDGNTYISSSERYWLYTRRDSVDYVLLFKVVSRRVMTDNASDTGSSVLVLSTVGKYGEVIPLQDKISFFDKLTCKSWFVDTLVGKLDNILK